MNHMEVNPDHSQKNRTDCQIPLTSAEQHRGLESEGQQARGQVQNPSSTLVRGLTGRGLICYTVRGGAGEAFAIRTNEHPFDGLKSDNELHPLWMYISHLIVTDKGKNLC